MDLWPIDGHKPVAWPWLRTLWLLLQHRETSVLSNILFWSFTSEWLGPWCPDSPHITTIHRLLQLNSPWLKSLCRHYNAHFYYFYTHSICSTWDKGSLAWRAPSKARLFAEKRDKPVLNGWQHSSKSSKTLLPEISYAPSLLWRAMARRTQNGEVLGDPSQLNIIPKANFNIRFES